MKQRIRKWLATRRDRREQSAKYALAQAYNIAANVQDAAREADDAATDVAMGDLLSELDRVRDAL